MHALCMVCGPLPTYASAWPAYAAFGMRMHATTQKPSLVFCFYLILFSYLTCSYLSFFLCICVSDAFVSHVLLLFTFDMLD